MIIVDKKYVEEYTKILTNEYFPVGDNERILVTNDICFPDTYHTIYITNGNLISTPGRIPDESDNI